MYITPLCCITYVVIFVTHVTYITRYQCYIHNSVIRIVAKGMSTNCYVYNTVVLYHLRCFICDPCYIHNSVIKIAAKGMSIKCYVYNTVTKTTLESQSLHILFLVILYFYAKGMPEIVIL